MGFRIPAPGFLRTGRGDSKPPGSPGWRSLPGSKAFGLQQPTGYHLFTIHSYLLPSPTQVGDAGRVREPMYWYRVGSVSVCVTDAKKASPIGETFLFVLALPIFPASHPASIVGADELNFCVRDGNRWTLIAINTNYVGRLFTVFYVKTLVRF